MSNHKINSENEILTSLKEKFFAGKAALEEEELSNLYKEFETEFGKSLKLKN